MSKYIYNDEFGVIGLDGIVSVSKTTLLNSPTKKFKVIMTHLPSGIGQPLQSQLGFDTIEERDAFVKKISSLLEAHGV